MAGVRITVACPADMVSDARSLAAYLQDDPNSLRAFVPGWQDEQGNPYFVASAPQSEEWFERAHRPIRERPAWDTEESLDMAGAVSALKSTVCWRQEFSDDGSLIQAVPQLTPRTIVAVVGMEGLVALSKLGLSRVADDRDALPDEAVPEVEEIDSSSSPGRETIDALKSAVAKNGPILTLQLTALKEICIQEIELIRGNNSLEPDARDRLLESLENLCSAAQEILNLLPQDSTIADAEASEVVSWAEVIKRESLRWNTEAKKIVAGKPADERVTFAGRIVFASAVAGSLTLMGLGSFATIAGGAILLNEKLSDIPKLVNSLRSGGSAQG